MNKEKIRLLFNKYFRDLTTEAENRELARLLQQEDLSEEVKQIMKEAWDAFQPQEKIFVPEESEKMLMRALGENLDETALPVHSNRRFFWRSAAAVIVLALSAGTAIYYLDDKAVPAAETALSTVVPEDVQPGSNKAFLTLGDGRDIVLDNASPGLLTTEGNTRIIKEEGDRLSYRVASDHDLAKASFHTLRTPRGGQYHLVLPDGTNVWLNAASSIVYPVQFNSDVRNVKIDGEVFFDVAAAFSNGKKVPFRVTTRDMSVEVLGTQFNINAYSDEKHIRTTLLEGSVKVITSRSSSMLDPGQEAMVSEFSKDIKVSQANTDQAIAWKNGYFQFQEATLQEIIRQLSKWYDVDMHYKGKPFNKKFSGEIPRSATLFEVLKILEIHQIRLLINGQELPVNP